jgi:hypothetical protein
VAVNKAPAYQWYPGDFRRDPRVIALTFVSRSVWRECLDAMFLDGNLGILTGTVQQLARICLCSPTQFQTFLTENESLNVADVTKRDGCVTLVNRRMHRAAIEREKTQKRVSRYREKRSGNADVTPPSSSSTASAVPPLPPQGGPDAQMRKGETEGIINNLAAGMSLPNHERRTQ